MIIADSTAEKALDVCNAILEGLYVEGGSDFEGSFLDKAEYINYLCNSKNYTEEQVQMCQEKNKLVAAVMGKYLFHKFIVEWVLGKKFTLRY